MESYLSVGVIEKQGPEHGGEFIFSTLRGRDVIELEDAHGRHGANITISILETGAQRPDEIFEEILDAQGAQTAQGEASDHGVIVMAVLLEEIDGEKSKVRMAASIIANIEVAHFFEGDLGIGGAHDHLGEEGGDVDADGHGGDDLGVELALEGFDAGLPAASQLPQLRLEVGELALASRRIGIHGKKKKKTKRMMVMMGREGEES